LNCRSNDCKKCATCLGNSHGRTSSYQCCLQKVFFRLCRLLYVHHQCNLNLCCVRCAARSQ
jgi:hypothetical protein